MGLTGRATKDKLVERLKVSSGLVERTKELGIFYFKINFSTSEMCPRPSFRGDGYLQLIVRIRSTLPDLFSRKNMNL